MTRYAIDISRHNDGWLKILGTWVRGIDWDTFNEWNCPKTKEGEQPQPPKIRDCWIKAGEPGMNYPVDVYRRQYRGAQGSMNPAPYWFHRQRTEIKHSPNNQAVDFYNRTGAGYRSTFPALDFEDTNVKPTKSLAQNKELAKRINLQLKTLVERTERLFKCEAVVYSAAWWWNWWAMLLPLKETAWVNQRKRWVANYVLHPGDDWSLINGLEPVIPYGWDGWDIWQVGQTNLPGFPTIVDLNIWKV